MPLSPTIHAATSNKGKLREFSESAEHANFLVRPLPGLAAMPEPVEDALTFIGNAEIKALAYSRLASGLLVLADDSGLEVAALHGGPGVRSARFADDAGFQQDVPTDDRNNTLLLQRLQDQPDRSARFVCALALARDGEVLLRAHGVCDGEILREPCGNHGFGYDPLFLLPALGLTAAELDPATKWQLSHRGNAFRDLLTRLTHDSSFITQD